MSEGEHDWRVSGQCVEGCTSPPVCPAYWNSPLQVQFHDGYSQCEGVWTFSIKEGHYDSTNLSDLMVAYSFNSPSPFPPKEQTPWLSIIYIDQRADNHQRKALEEIYRKCWGTMGEVIKVKQAKIEFDKQSVDGGPAARHKVRIEEIFSFSARPFRTTDSKIRYINSYWGGHIFIGISEENRFSDPDLPRGRWDAPNMSCTYYDFMINPTKLHWLPGQ